MAYNRRFNRDNIRTKTVNCSCGGEAKQYSKRNYPFGRNSDSITSRFYKCAICKKVTFINDEKGGGK
ncbi:hypothetical protein J4462_02295 [Candidatus Pacearchaeota archaeon]|nr:hypothetical protein [Candidatus Pacearchaeota archaeon]